MEQASSGTVPQSTFITVLAWFFIVIAGFGVFTGVMQIVMLAVFPIGEMIEGTRQAGESRAIPQEMGILFSGMRVLMAAILVLMIGVLAAAIGLLKRKNWARIAFVWIISIGILWNLVGFVIPVVGLLFFASGPENVPADFPGGFKAMFGVMSIFMGLMAIGFTVLFGWIIKKLVSRDIKAEFGVG